MDKFAKDLGITSDGVLEGDRYVIELLDSNEYSKVYSLLDKSDKVDLDGDLTLVSEKMSELTFLSDDYDVKLIANFMDDVYKVIIEKGE